MNNIFKHTATVSEVLGFLEKFKRKVVFLVDENSTLVGSLTDGDVRRYVLEKGELEANTTVGDAMNEGVFYIREDNFGKRALSDLLGKYNEIPVVDSRGKIKRIACSERTYFSLGDDWSTDSGEPFVIAEIGNNHQGSLETALALIKSAKDSGADCAKFQMRTMSSLYRSSGQSNDLGAEYTLDLLSKFQLSDEQLTKCFDYCAELGMIDRRSVGAFGVGPQAQHGDLRSLRRPAPFWGAGSCGIGGDGRRGQRRDVVWDAGVALIGPVSVPAGIQSCCSPNSTAHEPT